jgi:hypothetical protein
VGGEGLRVRMLNMSMEGRVENGRLRVRMLYMSMEGRVENESLRVTDFEIVGCGGGGGWC